MRVVLVDPSRTVLKFVSRLLEARHHEVRPFVDEREALDYIKSDVQVDALITSAELTVMSGIELCWEARLLATHRRQIYVIMMSSNHDQHRLAEALDGGADDFIGKPPVPEELYARLRAAERVTSMQRELIRLATTDPLTGVLNRRAFFERAQQMCERMEAGRTVSAIMMDIDHFKRINDTCGHAVGDQVLCGVAARAAATPGIIGRLGGEEFALIVESDLATAGELAEGLRSDIALMRFETPKAPVTPTCSFGVSQWRAGDDIDHLLRRADVALYAAKSGGRNKIVADDPGLSVMSYEQHRSATRGPARAVPVPAA